MKWTRHETTNRHESNVPGSRHDCDGERLPRHPERLQRNIEQSTSVPAATTTAGPSGDASSAQTLETRDDLVSPQAVAWDSWRLTSPDTIEIVFISGPADCEGASTEVIETDQDVTINLTVGSLPGVTECRAIAVQSRCVVTLEKELGDRQVRQDS